MILDKGLYEQWFYLTIPLTLVSIPISAKRLYTYSSFPLEMKSLMHSYFWVLKSQRGDIIKLIWQSDK